MNITRTAIRYERDHLGEAITVRQVVSRWFRKDVATTHAYARCWHETYWRGEDGRAVDIPLSYVLTGLRDNWEHDHPMNPDDDGLSGGPWRGAPWHMANGSTFTPYVEGKPCKPGFGGVPSAESVEGTRAHAAVTEDFAKMEARVCASPRDPSQRMSRADIQEMRNVLQESFECDCGREHPAGFVCNSTWKDSL